MLQRLLIPTHAEAEFVDITDEVQDLITAAHVIDATAFLYCPHTTCGLTIQENADPGVQHDMLLNLQHLAPRADRRYQHIEDNSASHLQASLMGFNVWLFVESGQLVLGRWQAIYLCEFDGPRQRTIIVKLGSSSAKG